MGSFSISLSCSIDLGCVHKKTKHSLFIFAMQKRSIFCLLITQQKQFYIFIATKSKITQKYSQCTLIC